MDYLKSILSPLLDDPEIFVITETADDRGTLLSIQVSSRDTGKIIGKQGKTIEGIRTIFHAFSMKNKLPSTAIKVLEPKSK